MEDFLQEIFKPKPSALITETPGLAPYALTSSEGRCLDNVNRFRVSVYGDEGNFSRNIARFRLVELAAVRRYLTGNVCRSALFLPLRVILIILINELTEITIT